MKKLYYLIALILIIIIDLILLFTIGDLYYILLAIIIAEIAIYSTAIIFEIINVQNKIKDNKEDDKEKGIYD